MIELFLILVVTVMTAFYLVKNQMMRRFAYNVVAAFFVALRNILLGI